jgi:hypothetical protein
VLACGDRFQQVVIADLGEVGKRFQVRTPQFVLERCFRDHGHPCPEQDPQALKNALGAHQLSGSSGHGSYFGSEWRAEVSPARRILRAARRRHPVPIGEGS